MRSEYLDCLPVGVAVFDDDGRLILQCHLRISTHWKGNIAHLNERILSVYRPQIGLNEPTGTVELIDVNRPFTTLLQVAGVSVEPGTPYQALLEAILQASDHTPDQQADFVQQRVDAFTARKSDTCDLSASDVWALRFHCEPCDDGNTILSVTNITEFVHQETQQQILRQVVDTAPVRLAWRTKIRSIWAAIAPLPAIRVCHRRTRLWAKPMPTCPGGK